MTCKYKCLHPLLHLQWQKAKDLVSYFDEIHFEHIARIENGKANEMAQIASGVRISEGKKEIIIKIQKRFLPMFVDRK